MAYYGSGTKIVKSNKTPALIKHKQNSNTLSEDIANDGLLAALPWVQVHLNPTDDNKDRKLSIYEYQFITLTKGDTIININNSLDR